MLGRRRLRGRRRSPGPRRPGGCNSGYSCNSGRSCRSGVGRRLRLRCHRRPGCGLCGGVAVRGAAVLSGRRRLSWPCRPRHVPVSRLCHSGSSSSHAGTTGRQRRQTRQQQRPVTPLWPVTRSGGPHPLRVTCLTTFLVQRCPLVQLGPLRACPAGQSLTDENSDDPPQRINGSSAPFRAPQAYVIRQTWTLCAAAPQCGVHKPAGHSRRCGHAGQPGQIGRSPATLTAM
jgi:hypothetical protein